MNSIDMMIYILLVKYIIITNYMIKKLIITLLKHTNNAVEYPFIKKTSLNTIREFTIVPIFIH